MSNRQSGRLEPVLPRYIIKLPLDLSSQSWPALRLTRNGGLNLWVGELPRPWRIWVHFSRGWECFCLRSFGVWDLSSCSKAQSGFTLTASKERYISRRICFDKVHVATKIHVATNKPLRKGGACEYDSRAHRRQGETVATTDTGGVFWTRTKTPRTFCRTSCWRPCKGTFKEKFFTFPLKIGAVVGENDRVCVKS